jgi:hypothetical protein
MVNTFFDHNRAFVKSSGSQNPLAVPPIGRSTDT